MEQLQVGLENLLRILGQGVIWLHEQSTVTRVVITVLWVLIYLGLLYLWATSGMPKASTKEGIQPTTPAPAAVAGASVPDAAQLAAEAQKQKERAMNDQAIDKVIQRTKRMEAALARLPKIQTVEEVIARLTKDQLDKLAGSLGVEFQGGITALTAMQLEAVYKHQEMALRMKLMLHQQEFAQLTLPPMLEAQLSTIADLEDIFLSFQARLKDERFSYIADFMMAHMATILIQDTHGHRRAISRQLLALFVNGLPNEAESAPREQPTPEVKVLREEQLNALIDEIVTMNGEVVDMAVPMATPSANGHRKK